MNRLLLIVVVGWLVSAPVLQAAPTSEALETETQYAEAFGKGLAAFQKGDLDGAVRGFQDAYLIHPDDPELKSWLSLVRDEQTRREVMIYALEDAKEGAFERKPSEPSAEEEPEKKQRPLWKRIFLPKQLSVDLPDVKKSITPLEKTRPEIMEEGKRAGFQRLYKEGIGFQPGDAIGVSARSEMFEEPNPIEDYILEGSMENWDSLSEYRRALTPLYTRSGAVRFVTDYEPWPRFTYEFDYRDIYHEYTARYGFKHRDQKTHGMNLLYTFPRIPFLGQLTFNPWYKRVIRESNTDLGSFENVDQMIYNVSLQPTDNIEYFFQFDKAYASKKRTVGGSTAQLYKGQVRLRFPKLRLFAIPSLEYSSTNYDPGDDVLYKWDMFIDWGFDVTDRLRASSKEQYVVLKQSRAGSSPSNPEAKAFYAENTLSYELFKDFDVSLGLDIAEGVGVNAYDNIGVRAEVELFKPGILRAKFGFERLSYYNISDQLSLFYMRVFLFQ